MAATYRTSAAGGGTSSTGNRSCSITTVANDLVLVFCSASGNTNTSPTCSDNQGGTYTLIDTALFSASANIGSWFVGDQLVGTGAATTITVATGSNTAAEIVAVAVAGMSRSGASAIRSQGKQENQASATTPAPALNQSALTGNITIGAVFNASNPATMTAPTNWTERQDAGQNTPTTGIEVVTRDSGFTGTTVTWGSTSGSAFASAIVELDGSLPIVNGTSSTTQAADTSSSSATVSVTSSTSASAAADTSAGSAGVSVQGSVSSTQGANSLSADSGVTSSGVSATVAATQDAQTLSASAAISIVGSTSLAQSGDTLNSASVVSVSSSAGPTQSSQTAAGTVGVAVGAAVSTTQGAQTLSAAAGQPAAAATLAITQGTQTLSAASAVSIKSTASSPQNANTASGSAGIAVGATVSRAQGADTVSGSGNTAVSASVGSTQGTNTSASSANVAVTATGSLAQSANTLSAQAGTPAATASASLTQGANTASSSTGVIVGSSANLAQSTHLEVSAVVVGVGGSSTIAQGSATLFGSATLLISVVAAASQAGDTLSASASSGSVAEVSGTMSVTQADNSINSSAHVLRIFAILAIRIVSAVAKSGFWSTSQERQMRQGETQVPFSAIFFDEDRRKDFSVFSTIKFRMVSRTDPTLIIEGAATGDANGNLSYLWATGDTDVAGDYDVVIICDEGLPTQQTLPTDSNIRCTITPTI